jgi:hypothetical protein
VLICELSAPAVRELTCAYAYSPRTGVRGFPWGQPVPLWPDLDPWWGPRNPEGPVMPVPSLMGSAWSWERARLFWNFSVTESAFRTQQVSLFSASVKFLVWASQQAQAQPEMYCRSSSSEVRTVRLCVRITRTLRRCWKVAAGVGRGARVRYLEGCGPTGRGIGNRR